MKRRPIPIQIIALGYFFSPFYFIWHYFYFSGVPFTDLSTWVSLLTPYKLSFILLPPVVGFGIYRIRIWGWYLALIHLFYVLGNNTLAYLVGSRSPPWVLFGEAFVTLIVLIIFVRQTVRAPYFNPRIRWWEAKPRYAVTLKVEMENNRTKIPGETYNISVGGMFLVSTEEVTVDEAFKVKLWQEGFPIVETFGKVIWTNPAGRSLPQGFGFVFTELNRDGLREIRRYIKAQLAVMKDAALTRV